MGRFTYGESLTITIEKPEQKLKSHGKVSNDIANEKLLKRGLKVVDELSIKGKI